jgi:hypothetical protein
MHRVMYYVGDALSLRTKVLDGRASLTQDALTITGPYPVDLRLRELHGAELFRLHGLGRWIRVSHGKGTVFISVACFILFGGYLRRSTFSGPGKLRASFARPFATPAS